MWTEPETTLRRAATTSRPRANCDPKPLQQPHPPIWIGGGGEQLTLRVVARLRRLLELRRQARRVRPQVRDPEGPLRRGRPRLRRDPQDLVARGVRPRDRGRGGGRRHRAACWGEPVESLARGQPRRAPPSRCARRSRPTSTSAAPASSPGAPTTRTPRRSTLLADEGHAASSAERGSRLTLRRSSGRRPRRRRTAWARPRPRTRTPSSTCAPPVDVLDAEQLRAEPQLRADRHRRREAHLVGAVVHAHRDAARPRTICGEQRRAERQREVAVGDRARRRDRPWPARRRRGSTGGRRSRRRTGSTCSWVIST